MNFEDKFRLDKFDLSNKQVFLRADLNEPIVDGQVVSQVRLKAIVPTLDFLIKKNSKIILATHLGRPKGYDKSLSTQILIPWFTKNNYKIKFAHDLAAAHEYIDSLEQGQILLLENLRFYPQEQENNLQFALDLRSLAQYYINDAFGLLHRYDTSITKLPELFDIEHKSIGFLVKKELEVLQYLKYKPKRPFVLIVGGGKVKDKLPLLYYLIDKVDVILLCPATVFTPLKALGKPVGKSLVEDSLLDLAAEIIKTAKAKSAKILFPLDYLVALDSLEGPLCYTQADSFPDNALGLSIGPRTIELYKKEINLAGTIFLNGTVGLRERSCTLTGFYSLLQAIAQSTAYTVIGGGGSAAAVYQYGFESAINFCSTGGGSTLAYLSSKSLPGLEFI